MHSFGSTALLCLFWYTASFCSVPVRVKKKKFLTSNALIRQDHYGPYLVKTLIPGDKKCTILVNGLYTGLLNSEFSVSYICMEVEKIILKQYMHSIYTIWSFWLGPSQNIYKSDDLKFTILVEGFLVYIILNSICLTDAWE